MNKKTSVAAAMAVSAVLAGCSSYLYAAKGWVWPLCITGCAVMAFLLLFVRLIRLFRSATVVGVQKAYRRKSTYISRAEWEFLQVLRNVVGARYEVCVQAPLVSVIDKVSGGAFRNELFRVVDYLIVDSVSYEPLLLVELNDASHNRADRRERDRKVAEICADAGMPLVAFTTAESHDVPAVRKTVLKMLR